MDLSKAAADGSLVAFCDACRSRTVLTFGQPCREAPWYPELSWVVLTGSVVLWANHLAEAPVRAFKQIGRVLIGTCTDALQLVLWFVLAAIPSAIVTPAYQCYTPRAKVSEVVLAASTLRSQVEDYARARSTLDGSGQRLLVNPSGRTVAGFITWRGEIIAIGDNPLVIIVLSPKFV